MTVITFITDFGTSDWFVGTMKGVVMRINSQAMPIDISHEIPAGDVRAGAFALMASYRFFPHQTVHVVVVDPGVGGSRAALLVQTADYFFLGPDNGVLSWALRSEKIQAIYRLENEKLFVKPVSLTFHGRDIFAPSAAHLSKGMALERFGPQQEAMVRLPWPEAKRSRQEAQGEILYIDRFGNAISNLHEELLAGFERKHCRIVLRGKPVASWHECYEAAPSGKPAAVISSSGFLELAINGGSAAKKFKLKVGEPITVATNSRR